MRGRSTRAGRRPPFREPRLRLLVVCGGERTEPDYFRGLKGQMRNPAIQIRLKAKGCAPKDLVAYARAIAPVGGDEFDQVWCVVDSDDFDLEAAAALAAELDVRLAVSNPCFELWLLLHHAGLHGLPLRCQRGPASADPASTPPAVSGSWCV